MRWDGICESLNAVGGVLTHCVQQKTQILQDSYYCTVRCLPNPSPFAGLHVYIQFNAFSVAPVESFGIE